jgi:hypothetical protein
MRNCLPCSKCGSVLGPLQATRYPIAGERLYRDKEGVAIACATTRFRRADQPPDQALYSPCGASPPCASATGRRVGGLGPAALPDVRQWRSIDTEMERWISVVETRSYQARAQKLLTREEQDQVIEMIARDPTCGVIVKGTGGVRKVRVAIGERGKSGGVRVVYFFHSPEVPTFLLTLFAKNEKDNLSMAERNQLAAFVEELKKHFKEVKHE